MGLFNKIFGKKKADSSFVPASSYSTVTKKEDDGYDPTDMMNPLNPFSPLSPFWIGDLNSEGDTHEFLQNDAPDAAQNDVTFGGGDFGGGGASDSWGGDSSTDDSSSSYDSRSSDDSSSSYDSSSSSDI